MNTVKFDYISDLHIDFLIKSSKVLNESRVRTHFDRVFKDKQSDYLIIAGDISEYIGMTFRLLKAIKEIYKYKKILFTVGNHDLYITSNHQWDKYFGDSWNKVNYLKTLLKGDEDLILLDGEVFDIEGVTIGGAMGMADNSYDSKCFLKYITTDNPEHSKDIWDYWKKVMNDAKYILPNKGHMRDYMNTENDKLIKVLSNYPDVVVSHYCPITSDSVTMHPYKNVRSNNFYMFDFEDYIHEYTPQVWVHGHLHSELSLQVGNTLLLRNPFGYPMEPLSKTLKTFEINVPLSVA